MTILLTGMCMPLAATFGLVLALLRRSKNPFLSWPAVVYIEVVRGTPLLVQLCFVYCSLLSTISVIELLNYLQGQGRQGNMMSMLALAALIYLILSLGCSLLGRWIERKLMPHGAPELKTGGGHGH